MDSIGKRLGQTRQAFNLNQATFCKWVGIGQQAWNNYERGRRRISVDHAIKVCQATGVSLDWIYRGIPSSLPMNIAIAIQEMEKQSNRER